MAILPISRARRDLALFVDIFLSFGCFISMNTTPEKSLYLPSPRQSCTAAHLTCFEVSPLFDRTCEISDAMAWLLCFSASLSRGLSAIDSPRSIVPFGIFSFPQLSFEPVDFPTLLFLSYFFPLSSLLIGSSSRFIAVGLSNVPLVARSGASLKSQSRLCLLCSRLLCCSLIFPHALRTSSRRNC